MRPSGAIDQLSARQADAPVKKPRSAQASRGGRASAGPSAMPRVTESRACAHLRRRGRSRPRRRAGRRREPSAVSSHELVPVLSFSGLRPEGRLWPSRPSRGPDRGRRGVVRLMPRRVTPRATARERQSPPAPTRRTTSSPVRPRPRPAVDSAKMLSPSNVCDRPDRARARPAPSAPWRASAPLSNATSSPPPRSWYWRHACFSARIEGIWQRQGPRSAEPPVALERRRPERRAGQQDRARERPRRVPPPSSLRAARRGAAQPAFELAGGAAEPGAGAPSEIGQPGRRRNGQEGKAAPRPSPVAAAQ